jgi:hypothetical protein
MKRRDFFGWVGKISIALGFGYLSGHAEKFDSLLPGETLPDDSQPRLFMTRMNGRACHDYRMISSDRSMILDREIFL